MEQKKSCTLLGCVVASAVAGDSINDLSCSGVMLPNGLVITTACIIKSDQTGNLKKNNKYTVTIPVSTVSKKDDMAYLSASLVTVWKCQTLHNSISKLFQLQNITTDHGEDCEFSVDDLSHFVLLETFHSVKRHNIPESSFLCDLDVGETVWLCSTPFASVYVKSFLNSVSTGIVSNQLDYSRSLFLCDVRCTPGCQGGVIFKSISSTLLVAAAMVLHPIVWRASEPTGLAIIGSLSSIFSSLYEHLMGSQLRVDLALSIKPYLTNTIQSRIKELTLPSTCLLVRVVIGNSWGTGVLLSSRYILTCAHVLSGYQNNVVFAISYATKIKSQCSVVYISQHTNVLDIGIIKTSETEFPACPLMISKNLYEGQSLKAYGFGMLKDSETPLVTKGVVSKIIRSSFLEYNVVTSCHVYGGLSGGIFVDNEGTIVGIILANMLDKYNGVIYSDVSLGIPMSLLQPSIQSLIDSESAAGFMELELFCLQNGISYFNSKL